MSKIKINGAKVILLSKLRVGEMSSADMMEHLSNVKYEVTRVRVHKIINELRDSGFITVSKSDREVVRKASSKVNTPVMIVKITKSGCDVISAYLDTEIGTSINDIKERVAATIIDEDKAKLEVNIKNLQIALDQEIRDNMPGDNLHGQSLVICEFGKQQLIAVEKCCIETLKWLHGS